MAQKKGPGTSLTLGMCSGVQRRGGGGTGHYRLLRAHAGPRGRWRQTGQPPHKASNQSAPIHCRWHQDPTGRMGVGDQGEESLGVRSAQSQLPVDRTRVNSNSSRLSRQRNSTEPSERCSNSNGWSCEGKHTTRKQTLEEPIWLVCCCRVGLQRQDISTP